MVAITPEPSASANDDLFGEFAWSPMGLRATVEDFDSQLWRHEARELFRGFAGALFVALPLLYTQEMWERAREIPALVLIALLVFAFVANVGFCAYSGFKVSRSRTYLVWDALVAIGLGLIASTITLFLTARLSLDTPLEVFINLLALMSVPTSFGAALAINQLGKRGRRDKAEESVAVARLSNDGQKILGTVLGATLFAFNIMPTIEPKVMLMEVDAKLALAILTFSLVVSYGVEHTARFQEKDEDPGGVLCEHWLTTLFSYLVALSVSGLLLWMFGYIGSTTPPQMWLPWVIIVGYAATLGGTAGRMIL